MANQPTETTAQATVAPAVTGPTPQAPAAATLTDAATGWLAIALVFAFVTVIAPIAVAAWVSCGLFGALVGARVLDHADAFSYFAANFGVNAGMFAGAAGLIASLAHWLTEKDSRDSAPLANGLLWIPLLLAFVAGGGSWAWQMVTGNLAADAGYAAAAVLVVVAGLLGSIPLIASATWATLSALWRFGQLSSLAAGVVVGVSFTISSVAGIAEWSAGGELLRHVIAEAERLPTGPAGGFWVKQDATTHLLQRCYMVAVAANAQPKNAKSWLATLRSTGAPSSGTATLALPQARSLVNDCVDALAGRGGPDSTAVDEVRLFLRGRYLEAADADAVANVALFEACLGAKDGQGKEDWRKALFVRAKWRHVDFLRARVRQCQLERAVAEALLTNGSAEPEVGDDRVEAALCLLGERDQCVLRAYLLDKADSEVMVECGLPSLAMVRKQRERALTRLKKQLQGRPASEGDDE